jgi:hypothetical protein
MTKVIMGFAILIGTLAICRLVNQPDYNDPEFWKGSPKTVFNTRPNGPGTEPTPVGGWEQFDKATNLQTEQKTERRRPLSLPVPTPQIVVETVQVQMDGKKQTVMILRPMERQTRDAAMLAAVTGEIQINK